MSSSRSSTNNRSFQVASLAGAIARVMHRRNEPGTQSENVDNLTPTVPIRSLRRNLINDNARLKRKPFFLRSSYSLIGDQRMCNGDIISGTTSAASKQQQQQQLLLPLPRRFCIVIRAYLVPIIGTINCYLRAKPLPRVVWCNTRCEIVIQLSERGWRLSSAIVSIFTEMFLMRNIY